MTKYQNASFSVSAPNTQEYRDRWEQTFGSKAPPPAVSMADMIQNQVRAFHEAYNMPILDKPQVPSNTRVALRLNLIAEEFFELLDACGVREPTFAGVGVYGDIKDQIDDLCNPANLSNARVDLVETADALADLAYVVEGMNLEFGIDSKAVLAEVQRSNMSKLGADGKPIYREDGKVTKGPNYSLPDIARVLGL